MILGTDTGDEEPPDSSMAMAAVLVVAFLTAYRLCHEEKLVLRGRQGME